jgi:transposase
MRAPSLAAVHFLAGQIMKRSYTYEEREKIVQFVSSAKEHPEMSSFKLSQLLELACPLGHVPHVNTYLRWKREHLSPEDHKAHLSLRGRHRLLSEQQEKLLIGYACDRRRSLLAVTQADLIDFSKSHFNITLHNWVITDITQRAGFSSQKAMKRESRMTTQKVVDDSIAFLEEVRSYKYSLDRIIIMDETGLWSNVVAPRTLHFVNGYTTSVFLNSHVS